MAGETTFSAGGMITGLRPQSFENLQLNAGIFIKNFDWKSTVTLEALAAKIYAALTSNAGIIGATSGGGSFQCTPTTRNIELDGMRAPFKGSTQNDMWTVKMTGTMKEITPENMALALMCADIDDKTPGVKRLQIRNNIQLTDYIDNMCWIGNMSDGGLVLIEITAALNLTGANFTFQDKGEGGLPFEFQGHQADLESNQYAPCEIVFFEGPNRAGAAPTPAPTPEG